MSLRSLTLAAGLAAVLCALPAHAVKYGEPDGTRHPQVGLMIALDASGTPRWRCSGTMISERVYLTAGHCTYGAARVTIWFESDVGAGRPDNNYPFAGTVSGTPYTHPDYPTAAFFVNDVGVVVLDQGQTGPGPYASLPQQDELDRMARRRGSQDLSFTAVGYGLQMSFPDAASWKDQRNLVRMLATPQLLQINVPGFTGDFSVLLSNNAYSGGTCYGDSGGPNFIGNTLVVGGVTSFGMNGSCAGTGGVFRMDRQRVLEWVRGFMP